MSTANGGSLDDCHTNFFSLTELTGLRWRVYESSHSQSTLDARNLLADPVFKSYGILQKSGVLCTWRRSPVKQLPETFDLPFFNIGCSKELWVFWFGTQDPAELESVTTGLSKRKHEDEGEEGVAITYDVRTQFFKAWHTLMETQFRKNGVIRVAKWFCRPLESYSPDTGALVDEFINAYSCSFTVVGNNTLCTSIRAQKQPQISHLDEFHLKSGQPLTVVLAPWSMKGILIPEKGERTSREKEEAEKTLNQWRQMNVLEEEDEMTVKEEKTDKEKTEREEKEEGEETKDEKEKEREREVIERNERRKRLAKTVRVEVEGSLMWYPSELVLVTLQESRELEKRLRNKRTTGTCKPQPAKVVNDRKPNLFANLTASEVGIKAVQPVVEELISARKFMARVPPIMSHFDMEQKHQPDCTCEMCRMYPSVTLSAPCSMQGTPIGQAVTPQPGDTASPSPMDTSGGTTSGPPTPSKGAKRIGRPRGSTSGARFDELQKKRSFRMLMAAKRYNSRGASGIVPCTPATPVQETNDDNSVRDETTDSDEEDDDEEAEWVQNDTENPEIGDLSRTADNAIYHYQRNRATSCGPCTSRSDASDGIPPSDGELTATSPFTPVSVLSPCTEKCQSSADKEKQVQFKKEKMSDGEKAEKSKTILFACSGYKSDNDYYFDPHAKLTIKKKGYHISRSEKRKKHIDMYSRPTFAHEDSSEEEEDGPGSQETIPATHSIGERGKNARLHSNEEGEQNGHLDEVIMAPLQRENSSSPTMRRNQRRDKVVRSKRHVTPKLQTSWPNLLDAEDEENLAGICGLTFPGVDLGSDEEERASDEERMKTFGWNGIDEEDTGEGTSGEGEEDDEGDESMEIDNHDDKSISDGLMGPSSSTIPMETDEGGLHSDTVLSPPASNERVDSNLSLNPYQRIVGGPPSAGDPSLNKIYPTPPSVLPPDMVQYSPAMQGGPHSQVARKEGDGGSGAEEDGSSDESASDEEFEFLDYSKLPSLYEEEVRGCKNMSSLSDTLSKNAFFDFQPSTGIPVSVRFTFANERKEWKKERIPTWVRPSAREKKVAELSQEKKDLLCGVEMHTTFLTMAAADAQRKAQEGQMSSHFPHPSTSTAHTPSMMPPYGMQPSSLGYPSTSSVPPQGMSSLHRPPPYATPPAFGAMSMQPYPPQQHSFNHPPSMMGHSPMIQQPPMQSGQQFHPGMRIGQQGQYGGQQYTIQAMQGYGQQGIQSMQQMAMMPQQQGMYHSQMMHGGPVFQRQPSQPGAPPPYPQQGQPGFSGHPQQMPMMQPGMVPHGMGGPGGMLPPSAANQNVGQFLQSQMQQQGHLNTFNQHNLNGYGGQPMGGMMGGQQGMNMAIAPMHMQMQTAMGVVASSGAMMGVPTPPAYGGIIPSAPVVQSATMTIQSKAEGLSVVVAVLLQDTILDVHFDWVFDSCPICACFTSIKAKELGVYISPPEVLQMTPQQQAMIIGTWHGFHSDSSSAGSCSCAFSAIRHRALSMKCGLFLEDAREATGDDRSVAIVGLTNGNEKTFCWFNPSAAGDMHLLDVVRTIAQTVDIGVMVRQMAQMRESVNMRISLLDDARHLSYFISEMDKNELLLMGNSVLSSSCVSGRLSAPSQVSPYFHPWGLQIANDVPEPSELEVKYLLDDVKVMLESAVREARKMSGSGPGVSLVEGPLTWRNLVGKAIKPGPGQEDELYACEPIPMIEIATEKEGIRCAPHAVKQWENLGLAPYEQPKDVMYVTVVPDNDAIFDLTVAYMRKFSKVYESSLHLGRHIPLLREPAREGVIRARQVVHGQSTSNAVTVWLSQLENGRTRSMESEATVSAMKKHMNSLKQHVVCVEDVLSEVLVDEKASRQQNGLSIYDRAFYRECLGMTLAARRSYKSMKTNGQGLTAKHEQDDDEGAPPSASPSSNSHSGRRPNSAMSTTPTIGQGGTPVVTPTPPPGRSDIMGACTPSSANISCMIKSEPVGFDDPIMGQSVGQAERNTMPYGMKPATTASVSLEMDESKQVEIPEDDPGTLPHVIVIYMVCWPCWGGEGRNAEAVKVSILALLRTYNVVLARILPSKRIQIQVELLPIQRMCETLGVTADLDRLQREASINTWHLTTAIRNCDVFSVERPRIEDVLKEVALSVYEQPRILKCDIIRAIQPKSMTKFGPASSLSEALDECQSNDQKGAVSYYKMCNSAYHIAPQQLITAKSENKLSMNVPDELTLFVSYCLVGSQFVVVSVTDALGKMNDNCIISLKPRQEQDDPKYRYKAKTSILEAMDRLWRYIQGVLSIETRPWRLVIGKLGKIGHGEFRAWATLLSKSNLKKFGTRMRESCPPCNTPQFPNILSACLVSTEPESNLQILPSFSSPVESPQKPQKGRGLHTPGDLTVTHILVFPTSADIQTSQATDTGGAEDDFELNFGDMTEGDDGMNDIIDDIMGANMEQQQPAGSRTGHVNSFFESGLESSVQNQPLASGWLISTAPAPELPDWFWSPCPSLKRRLPVHLRSSLHINEPLLQKTDDTMLQNNKKEKEHESNHPLDSQKTDEVLKYVLEQYNTLSWLALDSVTADRKSCLPIHIQALLRLHSTLEHLVL